MAEHAPLVEERNFYEQHLSEWLEDHVGKFVLVKGHEVVGFYDTADNALSEGARRFGISPFLVRRVEATQAEIRIPALMLGLLNGDTVIPSA